MFPFDDVIIFLLKYVLHQNICCIFMYSNIQYKIQYKVTKEWLLIADKFQVSTFSADTQEAILIKIVFYQHRNSHCKNKIHNGNPCTWKIPSLLKGISFYMTTESCQFLRLLPAEQRSKDKSALIHFQPQITDTMAIICHLLCSPVCDHPFIQDDIKVVTHLILECPCTIQKQLRVIKYWNLCMAVNTICDKISLTH